MTALWRMECPLISSRGFSDVRPYFLLMILHGMNENKVHYLVFTVYDKVQINTIAYLISMSFRNGFFSIKS